MANNSTPQAADNAAMEEMKKKLAEAEAKAAAAEKAAADEKARADDAEQKNAEAEAKLAEMKEQQKNIAAVEAKPEKITIKIPKVKNGPQEDVQVFINGRQYIIQRGVKVAVPRGVAEILSNQEKMLEVIDAYDQEHAQ